MKKIRAAICGASGYTGRELLLRLLRHSGVEVVGLAHGPSSEDCSMPDLFPEFKTLCELPVLGVETLYSQDLDAVFLALPHGASAPIAKEFLARGVRVIDFSADYRLRDTEVYEKWYKVAHCDKENLKKAVYGLCEWYRDEIKNAPVVAVPGCYVTSALIPLIPLLKDGVIETDDIIIDSKSGISGAGKKLTPQVHYCESAESFKAYGMFSHRHTPEIDQELTKFAAQNVNVTFTPHLLPIIRGILSTIYVKLKDGRSPSDVQASWEKAYGNEFFMRLRKPGTSVEIRHIVNSNFCDMSFTAGEKRVIITSALDNLVKGASGAALQNFNIMFGFPETEGLI